MQTNALLFIRKYYPALIFIQKENVELKAVSKIDVEKFGRKVIFCQLLLRLKKQDISYKKYLNLHE